MGGQPPCMMRRCGFALEQDGHKIVFRHEPERFRSRVAFLVAFRDLLLLLVHMRLSSGKTLSTTSVLSTNAAAPLSVVAGGMTKGAGR